MSMRERNINYYIRAFEKLDKGKWSWNWTAALFPEFWVCYRRMYRYYALWCILLYPIAIASLLVLLPIIFMGNAAIITGSCCIGVTVFRLISAYVFGRYGNSLYYNTVISNIRDGYHLSDKFQATSLPLALLSCTMFPSSFPCMCTGYALDYFRNPRRNKKESFEVTPESIKQYLTRRRTSGVGKKILAFLGYLSLVPLIVHWIAACVVILGCLFLVLANIQTAQFLLDSLRNSPVTLGELLSNWREIPLY